MTEIRFIRVFDTPSGMGGSFTVSIVEDLPDGKTVRLRVWYGRASRQGWVPWPIGTATRSRRRKRRFRMNATCRCLRSERRVEPCRNDPARIRSART